MSMHTCRICHTTGAAPVFTARETMYGQAGSFPYFQCPACECLQIVDVPDDLGSYYRADSYYSFGDAAVPGGIAGWLIVRRDRYAVLGRGVLGRLLHDRKPRLDIRYLSRLPLHEHTRMLDVGCGGGKLLRTLQRIGFRQLTGLDPFVPADIDLGRGARILKSTLDAFDEPQDVVMFNHSLEHVPDQAGTLRRAAALLRPGGAITVSIPIVSSDAWRTYGTDWVQLDAPRHLFLHSRRSFEHAAADAGLEIAEIFYDSNAFQFWGSEQCRRGIPLMDPRSYAVDPAASTFSADEIAAFSRRAALANAAGTGDQATFILRPRA